MDCTHFSKDPFLQMVEDIRVLYPGGIGDEKVTARLSALLLLLLLLLLLRL